MTKHELTITSREAVWERDDSARGEAAARMIWEDADGVDDIVDPRTPNFATAVVVGLANALAALAGCHQEDDAQRDLGG